MSRYIITITNPKYLTNDNEIILGAKNFIQLLRVIMKYKTQYASINIVIK